MESKTSNNRELLYVAVFFPLVGEWKYVTLQGPTHKTPHTLFFMLLFLFQDGCQAISRTILKSNIRNCCVHQPGPGIGQNICSPRTSTLQWEKRGNQPTHSCRPTNNMLLTFLNVCWNFKSTSRPLSKKTWATTEHHAYAWTLWTFACT